MDVPSSGPFPSRNPQKAAFDADRLFALGEFAAAERPFEELLAQSHNVSWCLFQLGRIAARQGRPAEAVERFDRALGCGDAPVWTHLEKAMALEQLGAGARTVVDELVHFARRAPEELGEGHCAVLLRGAGAAFDAGWYEDAFQLYDLLVRRGCGGYFCRLRRADLHLLRGDPEEALRLLDQLAADPEYDLRGEVTRARALLGAKRFEAAVPLLESVVSRAPDNADFARLLFRAWKGAGCEAQLTAPADRFLAHAGTGAKPHWLLARAEALLELDRLDEAEAVFGGLLDADPDFEGAQLGLAQLAMRRGSWVEALERWDRILANAASAANPHWRASRAQALLELGRFDEAEAVFDGLLDADPDFERAMSGLARIAMGRGSPFEALERWDRILARAGPAANPHWLLARTQTLFRLWRVEEALAEWRSLIARFPDLPAVRIHMAHAAQELGAWEEAAELWAGLIERFADRIDPYWLAARAKCLLNQRVDDPRVDQKLQALVAALETRFPELPLGCSIAIDHARITGRRSDEVAAIVEDAARRFSSDRGLLSQWVRVLLASGRLADAEQVVQQLEAGGDDQFSAVSRWLLAIDRDGEAATTEAIHRAVAGRSWAVEAALMLGPFLLGIWSAWPAELVLSLLDEVGRRYPGRIAIACLRARALITLRRDDEAQALIDSVPAAFRSREFLELRAWAHARRGEDDAARRLWRSVLARYYVPAIHSAKPNLEPITPERNLPQPASVTVFVSVRNEVANLPEFLGHYRGLGVRGFVAVDNMSIDGSDAYLREQPDVVLYRTRDLFLAAYHGMRWINALIERHGRGGWCLFADADEAFIYPGWESAPLDRFTEYLDREGAEAVAAFMLDVFPERLCGADGEPATHAECRYYDDDYVWGGHVRPPYSKALGGVRTRLFGSGEYLHKVPLIKSGRGVYITNHEPTHLQLAGVSGALLHYKLLALGRAGRDPFVPDRGIDQMRRYERYASRVRGAQGRRSAPPGRISGARRQPDHGGSRADARTAGISPMARRTAASCVVARCLRFRPRAPAFNRQSTLGKQLAAAARRG